MTRSGIILVGAGGHAAGVLEAAVLTGWRITAYVDRHPADWLGRHGSPHHFETDEAAIAELKGRGTVVIGIGGIDPTGLSARTALLEKYLDAGFTCPAIIHPSAVVSETASLKQGVIVLAGAVLQPYCQIGEGALINTRAIVEHHAVVEPGGHVAPGATLLGAGRLGRNALIGANAVVLPSTTVPANTLVPAGCVYKGAQGRDAGR